MPEQRMRFDQVVWRYQHDISPGLAKTTRKHMVHQLWFWEDAFNEFYADEITPKMIVRLRDVLKATATPQGTPRSNASVNRYLAALSMVMSFAVKDLFVADSNPAFGVRRLPEAAGRVRWLEPDERERLLRECKASRNRWLYAAVLLMMTSGLRFGEIRKLRWSDVDVERRWAILRATKNGTDRGAVLVPAVVEAIQALPRMAHGHVFHIPKAGSMRSAWLCAVERAGLENFHMHDLRHDCASTLAKQGVDTLVIAACLGHKSLSMVKRYAHLNSTKLTQVVDDAAKAVGL